MLIFQRKQTLITLSNKWEIPVILISVVYVLEVKKAKKELVLKILYQSIH